MSFHTERSSLPIFADKMRTNYSIAKMETFQSKLLGLANKTATEC